MTTWVGKGQSFKSGGASFWVVAQMHVWGLLAHGGGVMLEGRDKEGEETQRAAEIISALLMPSI